MTMYEVYSKPNCTYCEQAKALLTSLDLPFTEYIIDVGQVKDASKTYVTVNQLKERVPTARTVPQIFKEGQLIGGFDALKKMLG